MTLSNSKAVVTERLRLGRAMLRTLTDDFLLHGADVIAQLRTDKPVDYLKLVAAILPKELIDEGRAGHQFSAIERRIVRPEDPDG